jgi:mitochondrial import inner membrane translocase subunit TIM23
MARLPYQGEGCLARLNTQNLSRRSMTTTTLRGISTAPTARRALISSKARLPIRQVRFQTTAAPAASASPATPETSLAWNKFLALRKTRRRLNLTASILCAGTCFAAGTYVIAFKSWEDELSQAIGLDPIITMGLMLIGCAGVGWLIGPFYGTAVFQWRYRTLKPLIEAVSI